MRFSQRIGKKEVKVNFQTESIDNDLRVRLWNLIDSIVESLELSGAVWLYKKLWRNFLVQPVALMPAGPFDGISPSKCRDYLFKWFLKSEWYELYDLLEYLVRREKYRFGSSFIQDCNDALEIEISSYRIIDQTVVRINSELEIETIQQAIEGSESSNSVNTHLKVALDFLSNRSKPDYRNSIKESISAVESFCKKITGDDKATLGKALAIIEKNHALHPSLKSSFNNLYGYTSDALGIRHALTEDSKDPSFEEAKFMLVSCSAFINYLKSLEQIC